MFSTTLPIGCTIWAGGIPVTLKGSVEVVSGTPIKVSTSTPTPCALPDYQSIDDLNNNPNNWYYKSKK